MSSQIDRADEHSRHFVALMTSGAPVSLSDTNALGIARFHLLGRRVTRFQSVNATHTGYLVGTPSSANGRRRNRPRSRHSVSTISRRCRA